jgi:uncharacterized glyoxalase superfamily protein PhnB
MPRLDGRRAPANRCASCPDWRPRASCAWQHWKMTNLVPYLTFRHGEESLRFLTDGLGFERIAVQAADDRSVAHAELRRGAAIVMGGSGDVQVGGAPGLYLVEDDVEAAFERAVGAGADVVYGPEETEWGTKRARFRDLDGHEWSIGSHEPGRAWE